MDRTKLLRVGMLGLGLSACGGSEFSTADSDPGASVAVGSSASTASTSSSTDSSTASSASTSTGAGGNTSSSASVTATSGAGGITSGAGGTTGVGGSIGGAGGTTGLDASIDGDTRDQSVVDVGSDRFADGPRDASLDVAKCNGPSDCPPSTSRCRSAACTAGVCGMTPMPPGPIAAQTPGDCNRIDCTLTGDESIVADDSDADDGNECTKDNCANGVATHDPLMGSRCMNGTKFCDAAGSCVACLTVNDCLDAVLECQQKLCINGKCGITSKPGGTFCHGFLDQCDGAGNCVDCYNSGGCDECCVCSVDHKCIAASQAE